MNYSSKRRIIKGIFSKFKFLIIPSKENNFRSKILQSNLLLYFVVLLLSLRIITVFVSINLPQNMFFADITRTALNNFVNQTRQSIGLSALTENEKLNQAAMAKAENMVQNEYFDHTSPSGITPWFWFVKAGYSYKYAGENLAIGFYESREVFDAWLNSPSHKANIINPKYTEIGTAVLAGFGNSNSIIVVQEFASPKNIVVKNNSNQVVTKTTQTSTTGTETLNTNTGTSTVNKETNINVQTPTTNINTQTSETDTKTVGGNNEKVLSETTKADKFIGSSEIKEKINDFNSRFMNAVLYNYDGIIQKMIFGLSLIMMGILLTLILFNFKISFNRQLVFRAVLIIILLSTATIADRNIIIALIPHQILI